MFGRKWIGAAWRRRREEARHVWNSSLTDVIRSVHVLVHVCHLHPGTWDLGHHGFLSRLAGFHLSPVTGVRACAPAAAVTWNRLGGTCFLARWLCTWSTAFLEKGCRHRGNEKTAFRFCFLWASPPPTQAASAGCECVASLPLQTPHLWNSNVLKLLWHVNYSAFMQLAVNKSRL